MQHPPLDREIHLVGVLIFYDLKLAFLQDGIVSAMGVESDIYAFDGLVEI